VAILSEARHHRVASYSSKRVLQENRTAALLSFDWTRACMSTGGQF
jgi:hypothetical protein